MSTVSETNQLDVGGWSPDTLHAWVRSTFDQIDRRYQQRFTEQENALEKALVAAKEVVHANLAERDKAIEILACTMRRCVDDGDGNLRAHVNGQIEQLKAALAAADKLEDSRISGLQAQIASVHREIDIETAATKEAIGKADAATEKRFESVNEFRGQMADQSALFIARREVEAMVSAANEKIAGLNDRMNRNEGRGSGQHQLYGYLVGALGLLLAFYMAYSTKERQRNSERIDELRTRPAAAVSAERQ